jgi:hypothetical protein
MKKKTKGSVSGDLAAKRAEQGAKAGRKLTGKAPVNKLRKGK